MKNKNSSSIVEIGPITIYSGETKHLFSKEDQQLFENFDKKMPTFSKYFKWQKEGVVKKTKRIYAENAGLSLKKVIIQILATLPDFLTAENLVKVVGYITQTWEECQAKTTEKATIPTS